MKRLVFALATLLALDGAAQAQSCSGTPNANTVCAGPSSGGAGFPSFRTMVGADVPTAAISGALDNIGSTRGSVLERGAAGWQAVTPGTSGLPWVSNGTGADSGYQALTAAGIAAATITSTQIASGTITGGNIASATVASSNLAAGTAATNVGTLGGSLIGTLPNPGLGSAVVANSNLANMAAGTHKCRETGNGSGAPQDCSYPTIYITDAPFNADPTGVTDSTTAIQNAINALPASGGDVVAPCGVYKLSTSLAIGNGSGAAGSTVSGIIFRGLGNSRFNPVFPGFSTTACVRILWAGTGSGGVFAVNGPMQGWGIQNVEIDCNSVTASVGIVVTSAQFGDNRNLAFNNCFKSIGSTTVATFGSFTNTDSFHNRWYGTSIRVPAIAGAIGIVLTGGSTTSNTDYNTFIDTDIDLPTSVVAAFGIFNQFADTNHFYNTHIFGGNASATCLDFDYTGPSNSFPSANAFYGVDVGTCGGGTVAANGGSPGGSAQPNSTFITLANSMPIPAIANLSTSNPGAWASFTPTPTCGTATFSSITAAFQTNYKTTFFRINFTIATIGTCTNTLTWTLPNTAKGIAGFAGNNSNSGDSPSCRMSAGATTVSCNNGAGTNFAANDNLFFSGSYENQ